MNLTTTRYGQVVKIQRVGILGGGQLARMLALSAHPLGMEISVLAAQKTDPAAQVVGATRLGSLNDESDLRKFLGDVDAVTFESEFVDTEKLERCLPASVLVFPHLEAISVIQDRLTQKRLLDRYSIPTGTWIQVDTQRELRSADSQFDNSFVLKQRRFGYDGYGTFVFRNAKVNPTVLHKSSHGFIAEKFIPFRRELALSLVRSRDGEFATLPLVESVQKNSRCFSVHGPIDHSGIKNLVSRMKKMMRDLDYVGILAAELFETADGLMVNELAPRVHNSAHYSLDALTYSQFEYHMRAGLGLPLPKVEQKSSGFAMVNLLGEGGQRVQLSHAPRGYLHWYGKTENRAGRKLGHINVLDTSPRKALLRALQWRKDFKL
ncbi:MAG: 5-(carboxyamino)imidazole ribonucleotide synthase [Bdellovibrionales bacterium]